MLQSELPANLIGATTIGESREGVPIAILPTALAGRPRRAVKGAFRRVSMVVVPTWLATAVSGRSAGRSGGRRASVSSEELDWPGYALELDRTDGGEGRIGSMRGIDDRLADEHLAGPCVLGDP